MTWSPDEKISDLLTRYFREHNDILLFRTHAYFTPIIIPQFLATKMVAAGMWEKTSTSYYVSQWVPVMRYNKGPATKQNGPVPEEGNYFLP
jgi:hypothetical protein